MAVGKQSSAAIRAAALAKRTPFGGGRLISLKEKDGFSSGTYRSLPTDDPDNPIPGTPYVGIYSKTLKVGTTSPLTYGLNCPINDKLNELFNGAKKEEKEAYKQVANIQREQYMKVLERGAEFGQDGEPYIRVLPCKSKAYTSYTARISHEVHGEEVFDYDAGRDFVLEADGTGFSREYKIQIWCDPSPALDDPDMLERLKVLNQEFDLNAYIRQYQRIDWEKLNQIYQALCGDDIPQAYIDEAAAHGFGSGSGEDAEAPAPAAAKVPAKSAIAPKVAPKPAPAAAKVPAKATVKAPPPPPPEPEASDTVSPEIEPGTRIRFVDGEQNEHTGVVLEQDVDSDGDAFFKVAADDEAEDPEATPWNIWPAGIVEILPSEQAAEPEPEPTPPPPPAKTAGKALAGKPGPQSAKPVAPKAAVSAPAPKAAPVAAKPGGLAGLLKKATTAPVAAAPASSKISAMLKKGQPK